MGHCVGGLSLFMAIGGGMRGRALGDVLARSPATRSRRRATGARLGVRMATILQDVRHQAASTPTTTRGAATDKLIERVMRTLPFRHVYDNPVARRIYFIYGDVFDYANINKPTMSEAVPGSSAPAT